MRLFTLLIFHKKGYSQLIGGDLSTHEHSLVVFIKEGLPLICETSQESTDKNYLRSRLSLLHALLCFLLYIPVSAALTLSSDPPILISLDEPADSIIHEYDLVDFVKKGLPWSCNASLKGSENK